jgi:hypothetical protein
MLLPPRHLPRRFSRPASKRTSAFVRQRHKRHRQYTRERWTRFFRRAERTTAQSILFLRRWVWIALLAMAIIGFSALLFSPLVHIREIRVRRTDPRIDSERIQKALRPMFGRHLFFLTSHEVETLVMRALPDVQSVSIGKRYPSQLQVSIELHPLVARLEIGEPDAVGDAKADAVTRPAAGSGSIQETATHDYLTGNGLFVSLPFAAAGDTSLPLIRIVDWAVRPSPSAPLLPVDFLKRMNNASEQLHEQFGFSITGRTAYLRAREIHLSSSAYTLWLDMKSTLEEQLARYRIFLKSVQGKDVRQYVDLRLADRVIYK